MYKNETYHLGLTLVDGFRVQEHPIYNTWSGIKSRCNNDKEPAYPNYGGRGITYCDRWKHFKNFAEDMYPTYEDGLTIERIDNDGDYSPDNCRWATRKEQGRNASINRMITHDGKTQCLSRWAEESKINRCTISSRLERGWPVGKALGE